MNTIFDEYGNLNIEELIMSQPSFLKIIEDGIVTDEELRVQSERVVNLLHDFEKTASETQIEQMRELLAEISVLMAAQELQHRQ